MFYEEVFIFKDLNNVYIGVGLVISNSNSFIMVFIFVEGGLMNVEVFEFCVSFDFLYVFFLYCILLYVCNLFCFFYCSN